MESSAREPVSPAIIERCKEGDRDAWNELVRSTHREVYTLCLRILHNEDDAAEATQDTYFKVWRNLKSFRGEAAFNTWLYRVASNAALSSRRSRKRRVGMEAQTEEEFLRDIPGAASTEGAAGARMELRALEDALSGLPQHYRSALVLRDVYGLSTAETADRLGISETAAKVRVHRGRKRLKEMMRSDGWAAGGGGDELQ